MAYHNLCLTTKPPLGIGKLLGLGLKFCVQNKKPSQIKLLNNIQRFKRDIRLKHYFAGEPMDPDYIKYKKLYIKSDWEPDQCCNNLH